MGLVRRPIYPKVKDVVVGPGKSKGFSKSPWKCKKQCYEYCFGGRFGLSIRMKYFDNGLFRPTILYCFGIAR